METVITFLKKNPWGRALTYLVLWNVVVRLISVVGYVLLPERYAPLSFLSTFAKTNFLIWSAANFDGEHYLSIAKYGYMIRNGFPQYAFFPLLPLLIHIVAFFVRDYLIAGMIVSQSALLVALVYLVRWTKVLKLPDIRRSLLFSTGAIFLASVYTEPLFIALAVIAMYASEKRAWGRAILATALATATRVNGIFLVLFLIAKMWEAHRPVRKIIRDALLAAAGLGSYMVFLWRTTGDPLNWFHAQGAWGKAVATSPLVTLGAYMKAVTTQFQPDFVHIVVAIEVMVTVGAILLLSLLILRKQLGLAYWLYLAGNLAMPIATGSLGSMPRFFLTLFPLLIVIPTLPKAGKVAYYVMSWIAALIGIIFFTRGYWYG